MKKFKTYCVVCPKCKTIAQLVDDSEVYDQSYGNKIYRCPIHLNMRVGCHDDGKPYGSLADYGTSSFRGKLHTVFDPIWQSGLMTRSGAYQWLADEMGLTRETCHFGMFNKTQCRRAMYFIERFIKKQESKNEDKETR